MLTVHGSSDDQDKLLAARVEKCIRPSVYDQFAAKFATNASGAKFTTIPHQNIEKAASFLKIYLSGKTASKSRGSGYALLDLKDPKNILTDHQRLEFILSLLLFTMRNERTHGGVLSAFRTSKGTLERYESYYFAMLCAYIFALGVLNLRGFGSISPALIATCAQDNLALQKAFFA